MALDFSQYGTPVDGDETKLDFSALGTPIDEEKSPSKEPSRSEGSSFLSLDRAKQVVQDMVSLVPGMVRDEPSKPAEPGLTTQQMERLADRDAADREKLRAINPKAEEFQINALLKQKRDSEAMPPKASSVEARAAGYTKASPGMSSYDAQRNAEFDKSLESRWNAEFQKREADPVSGDRIQRSYRPEEEAARVQAEAQERLDAELTSNARRLAQTDPLLSGALSSLLSGSIGIANAPQTLVNAVIEAGDKLQGFATGADGNAPKLPKWGFTDEGMKLVDAAIPVAARKDLTDAWKEGDFGSTLLAKMSSNSVSSMMSLAAMFAPPLRAALLPTMGAMAAGQAYSQGDSAIGSTLKGGAEIVTEKLPLGVLDSVMKVPLPLRDTVLRSAADKLIKAGAVVTSQGLVNAIEESAAQVAGNAVDRYVEGKNVSSLGAGVADAAILGAATGGAMSMPAVGLIASEAGTKQGAAAQALAGALNQDLVPDTQDVVEFANRNYTTDGNIRPEATVVQTPESKLAALQAERDKLMAMRAAATPTPEATGSAITSPEVSSVDDAIAVAQAATNSPVVNGLDSEIQSVTAGIAAMESQLESGAKAAAEVESAIKSAIPGVDQNALLAGVEQQIGEQNTPVEPAFTAPQIFRYNVTQKPAVEGVEALSLDDADFELESLELRASKGRLTPESFAMSEIGKRLDTGTVMQINEGLRADPVGTVRALRSALSGNASPAAPDATLTNEGAITAQTDITGKPAASWVIRNRDTGAVQFETWNPAVVSKINTVKYEAIPVGKHLAGVNAQNRAAEIVEWADRETAPVGSWVKADFKLENSQPVYQVREVPIKDLYLPELTSEGKLQPEKRKYLETYTERYKAGEVAPSINVIEMEDGRLRVVDGHRRALAAQAAGQKTIRALVSPLIDTPSGKAEATLELVQNSPATDRIGGPTPQSQVAGVSSSEPTGPRFYGVDSQPMDEGGTPFKSQAEAKKAQKLQPHLRVKKVEGGFALTEKTAKQLAAEANAAKRLGSIGTGGKPLAAHEFLASMGGLSKSTMADLNFDKNLKLGGKYLFTNAGMSLERAVEMLGQYGYMQGTNQNDAITLIQKSAKGQPQYTPEGWEAIAQAESEARFEDHLRAQQDAIQDDDFDPFASTGEPFLMDDDMGESGYDHASSDIQAEVAALMEQAASLGIDTEAIVERAAQDTENQPEQAYYERTKQLIQDAIQASTGSRSNATDAGENSVQGRQVAEPAGRGDRGEANGSEGEQGAEGEDLDVSFRPRPVVDNVLTAPTEADVLANQDRAENANALDEREQIRRESEAGAGSFQLQAQDGRVDDTGSLFEPAGDYNAEAPRRKYTDDKQLQLFIDSGPDQSQAGPVGAAAQREAVSAVDDLRSTASILAQALSSDYAARQRVTLVGQTVQGVEDLAVLAQVYRDPRFETFRLVFVDDQGKVVSQVGLTSRLPASTSAIVGNDVDGYLKDLADAATATGATRYYMLHNHPSGIAKPSQADLELTKTFVQKMPQRLEMMGHVVIDTNQYTVIDWMGGFKTSDKDFGQSAAVAPTGRWGGFQIGKPDDVMDMAKQIQADANAVTLVVTDSQYKVRTLTTLPAAAFGGSVSQTRLNVLRATMKHRGGAIFAISRNKSILRHLEPLSVDLIHIDEDGDPTSLRSTGEARGGSLFPENRRTRLSPDTSPAFAYLRKQTHVTVGERVAAGEQIDEGYAGSGADAGMQFSRKKASEPTESTVVAPPDLAEKRVMQREAGNLNSEEQAAFDEFMSGRDDAERIMANLKQHRGTPWAKQAVEGIFVRQAMKMLLQGRSPNFQSSLDSTQVSKIKRTLLSQGLDGAWKMVEEQGGLMGHAAKPVNNVNSSFINCDPSIDCAKYCYATGGNYRYANVVVKSELITLLVEMDPVRAAQRVAAEYKATAEFANHKALRLFDKGDGDAAWLPFIRELNKQGVRTQIFSKRPDFLRSVPAENLRLLSIDDSNAHLADENLDLPVAFVYSGKAQIEDLARMAARNQIQVVLPIKLGQKLLDGSDVADLKREVPKVKPYLCPIDAGFKPLGKTSQEGTWNCTKCDKNGGVGCFHGSPTKSMMESLEARPHTKQERARRILELRSQINAITHPTDTNLASSGRDVAGQLHGLLFEVDSLLGELLGEYGSGAEGGVDLALGRGTDAPGQGIGGSVRGGNSGPVGRRVIPIQPADAGSARQGVVKKSATTTKTTPAFTPAQLRAAAKKTHGNLLEQGEKKGLVMLAGMDDLIDQAAKDRAAATGGDWQEIKKSILKSVQNSIRVWHGSPHRFTKFSLSAIGSGEGAQAYGWGLYFAGRRDVAEHYRQKLNGWVLSTTDGSITAGELADRIVELADNKTPSLDSAVRSAANKAVTDIYERAIPAAEVVSKIRGSAYGRIYAGVANAIEKLEPKQSDGATYEVNIIPDEDSFLLWDKPLSEQPEKVREALTSAGVIVDGKYGDGYGATPMFPGATTFNGESIYRRIVEKQFGEKTEVTSAARKDSEKEASLFLNELGIKGIKYLDGTSRGAGEGSFNYVVFDDADVEIIDVKFSANGDINGFHDPKTGKSYLNADTLTPDTIGPVMVHEFWHGANRAGALDAVNERALSMIKSGKGNTFFDSVAKAMNEAGETSAEEAAAYLVQQWEQDTINAPKPVKRWIQNLVAAVRAWLFNKGIILKANQLTEADIAAVARMLAKQQVGGQNDSGAVQFSKSIGEKFGNFYDGLRARLADGRAVGDDVLLQWLGGEDKTADPRRGFILNAGRDPSLATAVWEGNVLGTGEYATSGLTFTQKGKRTFLMPVFPGGVLTDGSESDVVQAFKSGRFAWYFAAEQVGPNEWSVGMDGAYPGTAFYDQLLASGELTPARNGYHRFKMPSGTTEFDLLREGARRLVMLLGGQTPNIQFNRETGANPSKDKKAYTPERIEARFSRAKFENSAAFRRWFGDSKVVDANGKPLVVYHGTKADISAFEGNRATEKDAGWFGRGIYFTADPNSASAYAEAEFEERQGTDAQPGANVIPVYLSLQNPYVWPEWRVAATTRAEADAIRKELEAAGHDGVIVPNRYADPDYAGFYEVIAFRPEQIKSAIGNNGNYDPTNPDIRFSRGRRQGSLQSAIEGLPEGISLRESPKEKGGMFTDKLGRVRLAPGEMLYDWLGDKASPMLEKLRLKSASPEMKKLLRKMKVDVENAQNNAVTIAKAAQGMSEAERQMVSDIIEKEVDAGTVPPEHAVKLAATMSAAMSAQSKELVRLGMLTQEAADRWDGTYLPRFYEGKLSKSAEDAAGDIWAKSMKKLFGRTNPLKGINGQHLKGRGLFETIDVADLPAYEQMGWEIRDPDYQQGLTDDGKVQVWRDFSRQERDKMNEIRDAGFRFVMGYMQTQKDIALGKMFEALAQDPNMSSRLPVDGWVQVPDTKVDGTGAKRYGKLSGRYVPMDVYSQLGNVEQVQSDALKLYRQALGIWKEGKTVLNPVSHVNNVLSNLTMAHFAGVSYWDIHKYLGAVRDFATGSGVMEEARKSGLFLGTLSSEELMNTMPEELRNLARKQDGSLERGVKTFYNLFTFGLRKPMGAMYQFEDLFFRYLIYKDARNRGLSPDDSIDYAQKYIFNYDDLPQGARIVRDAAIPFVSYTYKFIPAFLHTALTYPHRMVAPAALMWAANAAMYALAVGDDDDDWREKLKKYLTDEDYRKRAKDMEQLERDSLPKWMKGGTFIGTPKAIRLGMDEVTKLPIFLDVSRIVPGGDMLDTESNAGGVPWLQPFTPSHPLFSTGVAMFANKDLFFGKDIVDKNDTSGEAAQKRLNWIYKQFSPAIAVGQYHFDRTMNAIAQETGKTISFFPEQTGIEYTGVGRDGLPVQGMFAAMQTFGIKARPIDLEKSADIAKSQDNKLIREINAEIRQIDRLQNAGAISYGLAESMKQRQQLKKDRLSEGLTVDGDAKD